MDQTNIKINNNIQISLEIFPPNSIDGFNKLDEKCKKFSLLNPEFISVTFGAAGASQLKTAHIVEYLTKNNVLAAPHISCVGMTKQRLSYMLDNYIQLGIKKLIVIRGDCSVEDKEKIVQDFNFANELVSYIRKMTGNHFYITVAAYPEFHPQSKNPEEDLKNFKQKIDAGANDAITQYFFNGDAYFHFMDCCEKLNIDAPIVPGILPISDFNKLLRFSKACGAEIPLWLRKRLEQHANNNDSLQAFGIEMTTKLCDRLLNNGVKKLHFYTLNQVEPTVSVLRNLGFVS